MGLRPTTTARSPAAPCSWWPWHSRSRSASSGYGASSSRRACGRGQRSPDNIFSYRSGRKNSTMIPTSPALKRAAAAGGAVAAGLALAACGSSGSSGSSPLTPTASKGTVVVGSANFPENELLAQIYSTALTAKGVKVTDKFNIGAREVYYPQVKS